MIYYAGFMYSMAAFGPVLGFLLGAYLLSFHMDTFSGNFVGNIGKYDEWLIYECQLVLINPIKF
jgi:hypothetical protein